MSGKAEETAGERADGADAESGHPDIKAEGTPALAGRIDISIDLEDPAAAAKVREVLGEIRQPFPAPQTGQAPLVAAMPQRPYADRQKPCDNASEKVADENERIDK